MIALVPRSLHEPAISSDAAGPATIPLGPLARRFAHSAGTARPPAPKPGSSGFVLPAGFVASRRTTPQRVAEVAPPKDRTVPATTGRPEGSSATSAGTNRAPVGARPLATMPPVPNPVSSAPV